MRTFQKGGGRGVVARGRWFGGWLVRMPQSFCRPNNCNPCSVFPDSPSYRSATPCPITFLTRKTEQEILFAAEYNRDSVLFPPTNFHTSNPHHQNKKIKILREIRVFSSSTFIFCRTFTMLLTDQKYF